MLITLHCTFGPIKTLVDRHGTLPIKLQLFKVVQLVHVKFFYTSSLHLLRLSAQCLLRVETIQDPTGLACSIIQTCLNSLPRLRDGVSKYLSIALMR